MPRQVVSSDGAPKAAGPYSQAVKAGNLVFVSGQIPAAADGTVLYGEIRTQTRLALENLGKVLDAAGASLRDVVKTTVFLQNISDFPKMNEVYAEFFTDSPPARSTVAVKDLPKGVMVEIEAIALLE